MRFAGTGEIFILLSLIETNSIFIYRVSWYSVGLKKKLAKFTAPIPKNGVICTYHSVCTTWVKQKYRPNFCEFFFRVNISSDQTDKPIKTNSEANDKEITNL